MSRLDAPLWRLDVNNPKGAFTLARDNSGVPEIYQIRFKKICGAGGGHGGHGWANVCCFPFCHGSYLWTLCNYTRSQGGVLSKNIQVRRSSNGEPVDLISYSGVQQLTSFGMQGPSWQTFCSHGPCNVIEKIFGSS